VITGIVLSSSQRQGINEIGGLWVQIDAGLSEIQFSGVGTSFQSNAGRWIEAKI